MIGSAARGHQIRRALEHPPRRPDLLDRQAVGQVMPGSTVPPARRRRLGQGIEAAEQLPEALGSARRPDRVTALGSRHGLDELGDQHATTLQARHHRARCAALGWEPLPSEKVEHRRVSPGRLQGPSLRTDPDDPSGASGEISAKDTGLQRE